jgi:hypothetical protein
VTETEAFDREWMRCAGWIEAALEYAGATHTLEQVRSMVAAREAKFWAGTDAAMVTVIDEHPEAKALHLWLAGGDLTELVASLRPAAEFWARAEHNVTKVTILGRRGWIGELSDYGYRPHATLLVKDLA